MIDEEGNQSSCDYNTDDCSNSSSEKDAKIDLVVDGVLIFHTISIREIQTDLQLKVLIRRSLRPCYIKGLGVGLDDVSPPLYSPGEVSFRL